MMNRIILIGNGFNLAHGLPTSYKEFIEDYWIQYGTWLSGCLGKSPGRFMTDLSEEWGYKDVTTLFIKLLPLCKIGNEKGTVHFSFLHKNVKPGVRVPETAQRHTGNFNI